MAAFSGHAAATENVDLGNDIIMKESVLTIGLKQPMPAERVWNHDWDRPTGKTFLHDRGRKGLHRWRAFV